MPLLSSRVFIKAFPVVKARGERLHYMPRQALFCSCRNRYWQLDTYMLPVCTLTADAGDSEAPAAE